MQVVVRGHAVPMSEMLHDHCKERVARSLAPFRQHIREVELVLVDFNGPRGGPGHAARLTVVLLDGSRLLVQMIESNFYLAAGEAAARMGQLVQRELSRNRALVRRRKVTFVETLVLSPAG